MEIAFWCGARCEGACSLVAPCGLPNCAKSETTTRGNQSMEKRGQAKPPNCHQGHLGSPPKASGALNNQCQRSQGAIRHYLGLARGYNDKVRRRATRLREFSKPSIEYTNGLSGSCFHTEWDTSTGSQRRTTQERKSPTLELRARSTGTRKCAARNKTRKNDKHCTFDRHIPKYDLPAPRPNICPGMRHKESSGNTCPVP